MGKYNWIFGGFFSRLTNILHLYNMKTKKTIITVCLLLLANIAVQATGDSLSGQTQAGENNSIIIDDRLWGAWNLEAVEITTGKDVKTYTLETLLANANIIPSNLFTLLVFFENIVEAGISHNHTEFASEKESRLTALKGTFTTKNGQLTINLHEKQPRTFVYSIENNRLKISFNHSGTQFNLIYKSDN